MVDARIIEAITDGVSDGVQHTTNRAERRHGVRGKGMSIHSRADIDRGEWDFVANASEFIGFRGV